MAITPVQVPSAPQPVQQEKGESWMDIVLKGLQAANAFYGIKSNIADINLKQTQANAAVAKAGDEERISKNNMTPEEYQAKDLTAFPAQKEVLSQPSPLVPSADPAQRTSLVPSEPPKFAYTPGNEVDKATGKLTPKFFAKTADVRNQESGLEGLRGKVKDVQDVYTQAELNFGNIIDAAKTAASDKSNSAFEKLLINKIRLENPNSTKSMTDPQIKQDWGEVIKEEISRFTRSPEQRQERVNSIVNGAYDSMSNYASKENQGLAPLRETMSRVGYNPRELIVDRNVPQKPKGKAATGEIPQTRADRIKAFQQLVEQNKSGK